MGVLDSFTPIDLYGILYDIANSMPMQVDSNGSEIRCARLQTVAVVKSYASEAQTANLGKDSRYSIGGKKIYFSRADNSGSQSGEGLKYNFPALLLGEQDESYTHAGSQYNIDYSIAISDRCEQAQGDAFNQSICEQRTYEEVAQALRQLWQTIYATLNDYIYADLYNGNTYIKTGWYSVAGLAQLIDMMAITHYDEIAYLNQYLSETNKAYISYDLHTESTISYFLNISVQFFGCVAPIAARPQEDIIVPIIPNDPDAQALFDAIIAEGGAVTELQEEATNTAIIDLKAAGLWAKAYAFYFMIGGTAVAHKFNAKNPIDTDAAFRLAFTGGWVHSATGAKPNGVNAFANTFFTPSINAAIDSIAISYYSGSNAAGAYIEMGAAGTAINPGWGQLYIVPNLSGTAFRAVNVTGNSAAAAINAQAMLTASRTDGALIRLHRNEILAFTDNGIPNTASNKPIYIGARNNNGTADAPSARECRSSGIFSGLTAPETVTLYNIVEAFQTKQNRNNP